MQGPSLDNRAEQLLRQLAPQVLGAMIRRYRDFAASEDAVQTLVRTDLSHEAIRLTRAVYRLLRDDTEVAGLLALMLLTDSRRAARTGPNGELIPLTDQDRTKWDGAAIAEGVALRLLQR